MRDDLSGRTELDPFRVVVETITPQMAAELLARNIENRPLRASTVSRYAQEMTHGLWQVSPQPIIVGTSGRLLDGQHRLTAVVKSGQTVQMAVARNVSEAVFSVLDRGVTRSLSDATGRDKRRLQVARLLATILFPEQGGTFAADSTVLRVDDLIGRHHDELYHFCAGTARIFSSAPFRAAAVLHRLQDEKRGDYAFLTYRAMVLMDVQAMPPVAVAAYRAMSQSTNWTKSAGSGEQSIRFYAALKIFDPANAKLAVLRRPDPEREGPLLRAWVLPMIERLGE